MKKDARTQTDYIYMCLHSNPQKDRKVWHIVEKTYSILLGVATHTHIYIYPNIRAFTVQAEFCIADLRGALHAKPDFFQLAHSASGIILFGLFIPKEFDCDEPFLGHPHTGSQDVASSSHAARTPRCIFGHLRGKESGIQDVAIGALHP